jgi:hypothetical protein
MAEAIQSAEHAWMRKPCNGLGTLGSYDTAKQWVQLLP